MSWLFYRGARVYHRLENIREKQFVVSVDKGDKRFFINFCSADAFESWYVDVPPDERTMNEVVMSDTRKLVIDIDGGSPTFCEDSQKISNLLMFDFERHVQSRIREIFAVLEIGIPDVVMYRMTDELGEVSHDKLSYHAIVSNFRFSAKTCMGLCMIIASEQAWDKCADTGIYKAIQCVRMEGSTKFGEKRWKWATSDGTFKRGLVSHLEDTVESGVTCNPYIKPASRLVGLDNVDMSQFKACRSRCGKYVHLQRTRPGYCTQCNRTHDRENAALLGTNTFVCWRSFVGQRYISQ